MTHPPNEIVDLLLSYPIAARPRDPSALEPTPAELMIRPCHRVERCTILAIVNEAAERYRGVIPTDCWHEPYMAPAELERDIAAGVVFWGCVDETSELVGVMGIQAVKDVHLIRHAYVRPDAQGRGVGSGLLSHLETLSSRPILIGTWAAATWAIGFYQSHGYTLVAAGEVAPLLQKYWTVSPRQVETSVVLAKPARNEPTDAASTAVALPAKGLTAR